MEVSAKLGHGIKEAFSRLISEVYRSMEMEGLTDVTTDQNRDRREAHTGSVFLDSKRHLEQQSYSQSMD